MELPTFAQYTSIDLICTKGVQTQDYMEVIEADNFDDSCSHYTQVNSPSWCTYENSNPEGDSAFVTNMDDYYYDDGYEI